MDFTKLKLSDKELIEHWLSRADILYSISDFATLYEYDLDEETVFNICDDVLTIRNTFSGHHVYFCPIVPDDRPIEPYLQRIREHEGDSPFTIGHIPEKYAEELFLLEGFGTLTYDRDDFDYIYNTTDLITLQGRKYHPKRNFIHRFCTEYDYEFRDYTDADYDAVFQLFDDWSAPHAGDPRIDVERAAIARVLPVLDVLNMKCGLLFVGETLVAFGIVSITTRGIGQAHFEKARSEYEGAYAVINNFCASRYLAETTYINRQEDMGAPGLRAAKLSYHPAMLAGKYKLGDFEL